MADNDGLVQPPASGSLGLSSGGDDGAPPNPKRKFIIAGIGVAALLGIYLYAKHKSSSSSSTTTTPEVIAPSTPTNSGYTTGGSGTYTGGGTTGVGGTTNTQTGYTPPANEVLQGAGYWGGNASSSNPVTSASGAVYSYLPNWNGALALANAGEPVFYQPSPGVFAPAETGGNWDQALFQPGAANTPLYVQQSLSV